MSSSQHRKTLKNRFTAKTIILDFQLAIILTYLYLPSPPPPRVFFCLVPSDDRVLRSGCNRHEWEISFLGEGFLDFKLVKEFFLTPLGQNKVKKVILHMLCARKVRFDSWSVQKNIFCRGILGCLRWFRVEVSTLATIYTYGGELFFKPFEMLNKAKLDHFEKLKFISKKFFWHSVYQLGLPVATPDLDLAENQLI